VPLAGFDGVQIHYEITGEAGQPVLVLSHSLGANLAMWQPQVERLASHVRLLGYDTRGHGASSAPSGPCTIAELGEDVLSLLDLLELEQASFCGLSMGGVIGQWLGIHAPHRIHKLILANTAAKIGTTDAWNQRIATVSREGLHTIIPATLERWFTADFRASQPEAVAAIEAMLQATNPQGYAACCAAIRDADFRRSVHAIAIPTMMIAGSQDPSTPPEEGRFLADNIAGSRLVELPTAHLSNVEAADEFNAALLGFLGY
jgi:3-oxoadipate enol-lactonase